MTDKLPPNLLALFAPRPPLRWVEPPDHAPQVRQTAPISGVAAFLPELQKYKQTDVYEPTESWLQMRDRKKQEKKESVETGVKDGLDTYKPNEDPNIRGDAFKTLIVARLSYDADERDLEREFGRFGPIERIRIITDTRAHERPNKKKKPHRGYAFVVFEREKDMRAALESCDGIRIKDRRIKVDVERGRTVKGWKPRRLGGGLGGRGYTKAMLSRPMGPGGFGGGGGGGFRGGFKGFEGGRGRGGFRGGFGGRGGGGGGFRGGDRGGGRGGPRGGGGRGGRGGGMRGGRGGMRGGAKVLIEPHKFAGVFIARSKEDALVTKSLVPGESVYNEKRIQVPDEHSGEKVEYRVWNAYRSKLAATILGGVDSFEVKPGARVLYLGAASGTTVSHVADIVGPEGIVYAVEFSYRSGRDLVNMAQKRTNVVPIIGDARKPLEYRMLVGMVDCVFADVAQRDQARIIALNCRYFLKYGGQFIISIKANCIDSTNPAAVVFENEINKIREEGLTPQEKLTLEPYERDHAVVVGVYKPKAK